MSLKKAVLLDNYRKRAEILEDERLYNKASLSKNHTRYDPQEKDHRLPYKRDVDRIIHSKAYTRYSDKTQVVYLVDNDHITHRSLHVQLVSSFSRGIAEILRLNLDLVEAISLGHDVGHPPFGHEGEGYLSELSIEHRNGPFTHSLQSCRLFSEIEPLNLGLAVYDGFLCHDGGLSTNTLHPQFDKTWIEHFEDRKIKTTDPDRNIFPGTLEGCLVKLCDTISYLGRDIEDAIRLNILSRNQIPNTILGTSNKEILTVAAQSIIEESYDQDYISIHPEILAAIKEIRRFNFDHIYTDPNLKVESQKIKRCYRIVFEFLLNDFTQKKENSFIWIHFLHNKDPLYIQNSSNTQLVIDYLAGMTDSFFIRTMESIAVPKRISL